jgi:hypothetical protein
MQIVIGPELFAKAEVKDALTEMQRVLREALPEGSFAEREAAALALSNEAVRGVLLEELKAIAASFPDELLINGVAYKRHEPGTGNYHGLCGPLPVGRDTFRQMGVRNGPTVVPLDLVAGLIEGATPALAYNIAHGYAQHDTRVHEETLRTAHRVPPSRATLERIAKDIGAATVDAAPHIEPLLRRGEKVPEDAVAVVMGLDRTAVAMIEDRPADAPPKPEPKRRKPRVRQPPPPFDINWRMAYVGTVSFVDANGETIEVFRYAAPACDDPRELVKQMSADVRRALRQNPTLNAGIVQDGAREMWDRTREGMQTLRDEGLLKRWYEGIDRYHLLERLGKALAIVESNAEDRTQLLAEWQTGFDARNSTIDDIDRYFTAHYGRLQAAGELGRCAELWEHLRYIGNHKSRMRYVSLRNAGLPVGSGVTESSAKTVIGQRAKGSGQRWREPGLRGVLTLRALDHSDRLPRFWARLARRYTATVEAAA